jgi:isopentenyl phosphate kinase
MSLLNPHRNSKPKYTVFKLGGSVITNRNGFHEFDHVRSDRFACCFASAFFSGLTNVIVILGGGSFAHPVIKRRGISFNGEHVDTKVLFELPIGLFRLKQLFMEKLQRHGISALPFHVTSFLTTDGGEVDRAFLDPIQSSIYYGFVPVLSGGLTVDKQVGIRPISSDRIPLALVQCLKIQRFVALTDQPGIRAGLHSATVFGRITKANYQKVRRLISPSQRLDFSGGMLGKFDAVIQLAKLGVCSVICDGRDLNHEYFAAMLSDSPPGTVVEPW